MFSIRTSLREADSPQSREGHMLRRDATGLPSPVDRAGELARREEPRAPGAPSCYAHVTLALHAEHCRPRVALLVPRQGSLAGLWHFRPAKVREAPTPSRHLESNTHSAPLTLFRSGARENRSSSAP